MAFRIIMMGQSQSADKKMTINLHVKYIWLYTHFMQSAKLEC